MDIVRFKEYEDAKFEIIRGVEWHEEDTTPYLTVHDGIFSRSYITANNGTFFELFNSNTGIVEFWTSKKSTIRRYRYYDNRSREEICKENRELKEKLAAIKAMIAELVA